MNAREAQPDGMLRAFSIPHQRGAGNNRVCCQDTQTSFLDAPVQTRVEDAGAANSGLVAGNGPVDALSENRTAP